MALDVEKLALQILAKETATNNRDVPVEVLTNAFVEVTANLMLQCGASESEADAATIRSAIEPKVQRACVRWKTASVI
jgi:hypothetical protein